MKNDNLCFCCSLRIGAIIIGVICLIVGVISASLAAFGLSGEKNLDFATHSIFNITDIDVKTSIEEDKDGKASEEYKDGKGIVAPAIFDMEIMQPRKIEKGIDDELDNWYQGLRTEVTKNEVTAYLVVQITLGLLEILSASSLLFGVCQLKPSFMVPILILIPVDLAVTWITRLVIAGFNVVIFLSWFPITLLWIYFWVCLLSFWQEQKEEMKPEPV